MLTIRKFMVIMDIMEGKKRQSSALQTDGGSYAVCDDGAPETDTFTQLLAGSYSEPYFLPSFNLWSIWTEETDLEDTNKTFIYLT